MQLLFKKEKEDASGTTSRGKYHGNCGLDAFPGIREAAETDAMALPLPGWRLNLSHLPQL